MATDDMLTIEVEGLADLDRALSVLPNLIAERVLKSATLAGAAVVRKEARALCPKNTGALAKSIVARKMRTKAGEVVYRVGPGRSSRKTKVNGKIGYKIDGWYAHLVEFGTSPHVIKASKGKVLALRKNSRASKGVAKRWINTFLAVHVSHPGASPKPFLRPAFDTKVNEVIKTIGKRVWRGIQTESRKLYKQRSAARKATRLGG